MTALGFQTFGGLQTIESGLNDLRRSQLMIIPEFKYMYGVIQKHHDDLKFAHITGKAKDLLDQAIRDTKFYNILIKMLCEVKQRRSGEQRAGLRQVYTWYMANKHNLYCGPRFGKEFMRDQAKEILQKSVTAKNKRKSWSSRERSMNSRNISGHSVPQIADICTAKENLDPGKLLENPVTDMQEINHNNNPTILQESNVDVLETSMNEIDDSSYASSDPVLTRPKTAITVTISHLNDKSSHHLPSNLQKVTTMVHPLSTLVNPHAQMPLSIDNTSSKDKKSFISHIASGIKPDNLQTWQAFNKNRSYGQDIVGKLNFVGRSGTAFDVRYAAHSQGETPEAYTKEFLRRHFRELNTFDDVPSSDDEENYFVRQTLEEFYQTADIIRPTTRSSSRMSTHSRIKSAKHDPPTVSEVSSNTKEPQKLGHQLELLPNNNSKFNEAPTIDTGVKLNEVVNKIDSVSEEMTYFKEKLVPQPQHGYRQPSVAGLPTPREEETTTMKINLAQSTSDLKTRPATSYSAKDLEKPSSDLRISKLRCKSASGIDWRGRIEPDSVRYKWSKTKFGSHTYLKKWIGSYDQNSGSSSARKRPKTAPNATKEKWKSQTQDKSVRAVQAASHDTTLVDQKDVDSMMTIQHLLPGDDGIDPRSLYDYDQKFWKNVRKSSLSAPVEAPKEFLSFISSTPTLLGAAKNKLSGSQIVEACEPLP